MVGAATGDMAVRLVNAEVKDVRGDRFLVEDAVRIVRKDSCSRQAWEILTVVVERNSCLAVLADFECVMAAMGMPAGIY